MVSCWWAFEKTSGARRSASSRHARLGGVPNCRSEKLDHFDRLRFWPAPKLCGRHDRDPTGACIDTHSRTLSGSDCTKCCLGRGQALRRIEEIDSSWRRCSIAPRRGCHGVIFPSALARGKRYTIDSRTGRARGIGSAFFAWSNTRSIKRGASWMGPSFVRTKMRQAEKGDRV
jgi:hypothetical protein